MTSFRGATAARPSRGLAWTGWIGSAPVQISERGLDGAPSWWCDELLLVVVVLRLSVVPRWRAIGLLVTKGIPLWITADREKGRVSWCQVGLPAQSLSRHHFRHVLHAFICKLCMRVCMYVFVCMCADMISVYNACVYVFVHLCVYTHDVCIFVHRLWVLACGRCHACTCVFVCICMRICMCVGVYICAFFCSECYMHFTGFWALVYGQLCMLHRCIFTPTYTSAKTLAVDCAHMCTCIYVCVHAYAYGCVCASMILLDTLRWCC